jgi:hypothetical protein
MSSWLQIHPQIRVRIPALPDFLRSTGSGTGPTQPREYLEEKVAAAVYKTENISVGIRHTDHISLSIHKLWH